MYRLTVDGVETYMVVTRNVFSHRLTVHRKYDLKVKGSVFPCVSTVLSEAGRGCSSSFLCQEGWRTHVSEIGDSGVDVPCYCRLKTVGSQGASNQEII